MLRRSVTLCDCAWASAHRKTTSATARVRIVRDRSLIIRFGRVSEADRRDAMIARKKGTEKQILRASIIWRVQKDPPYAARWPGGSRRTPPSHTPVYSLTPPGGPAGDRAPAATPLSGFPLQVHSS